jgi:hypothetical protein
MEKIILTKEQLENWRKILPDLVGEENAFLCTDEEIQMIRDALQEKTDELGRDIEQGKFDNDGSVKSIS